MCLVALSRRAVRSFLRDQNGSATVESVLWMPIFIFLLGLIADTSIVFGSQSQALRIVQDANRALAVGHFATPDEAKNYVKQQLSTLSPHASVTTTVTNGVIRTSVSMPIADLAATGLVTNFNGMAISVSSEFLSEV